MAHRFTGIFAILPTPFDEQGQVDVEGLRSLVEFQIKAGVAGLTILGILGEFQKMTEAERDLVTRTIITATAGRVPVIVGSSATGTDLAIHYSRMAAEAGAAGLMVAPPTNLKNMDAVLEYYKRISKAVDLPMIVQDEPVTTGVLMPPAFLARVLKEVPTSCGIKLEEPPTPAKASKLLELAPDAAVFGGLGGVYFLEEMNRGCVGTMTGFAFPEILVDIYNRFVSGDRAGARDVFYRYNPIIRFEGQQNIGLAIRKEIFVRRGVFKNGALRHPGVVIDPGSREELTEVLAAVGLSTRLHA
jgi:4-hydroxy-tetrahydrodipicolinate synthase